MTLARGAALCVLPLILLAFSPKEIVDDAYISYRHAWNLLHGHGLVYNAVERVEGFTNLLWTLISAVPLALGIRVDLFCSILGGTLAATAVLRSWRFLVRLGVSEHAAWGAALLVALFPGYYVNAVNGLEAGLFSLLLVETAGAVLTRRQPLVPALLGGLLFTTRPESAALLPLCVIFRFLADRARSDDLRWIKQDVLRMALGWGAIIGAVTAWRLLFYGHPLPNSVAAKAVNLTNVPELLWNARFGAIYLRGFFLTNPLLVVLSVLGLITAPRALWAWLGGLTAIGAALLILLQGGDWMLHFRLLTMYAPFMMFPAAAGLGFLGGRLQRMKANLRPVAGIALAAAASFGLYVGASQLHFFPNMQWELGQPAKAYEIIARALRGGLQQGDVVAGEGIGMLGIELPETYVHDFLGLTDEHLAHHGTLRDIYGRRDYVYTARQVRPAVYIVHSGFFHLSRFRAGFEGDFNATYESYDVLRPQGATTHQMMVSLRSDVAERLRPLLGSMQPERATIPLPE
ncbi:hypothetical protein MYSTI_03284 [Myxococcus stipitatus DSM 14675]|uniref:Glycosyltransferase RgtA/B/C/D-like domain-containing protein n=2 Tax=Myxococcus stipitatus TaxID=83455 RepID=L7U6U2_MYXSD|nr:hypothetical protein MYSTI_03284 [Myxococcus stipitatus DSM 14675]